MSDQERIELYCNWATAIAKDDQHGYSQVNRWSPDYDCSSLVISALEQAGFRMRSNGASYTGNMMNALLRVGFALVFDKTLKRGDILLTHTDEKQHTAIYLGNGRMVHARGVNGHPEAGDQTGLEITISQYYPFEMVFRYPVKEDVKNTYEVVNMLLKVVKNGSKGHAVKVVQTLLNQFCGYYLEVDGICGEKTTNAIKCYQGNTKLHPNKLLVADGIVGAETWSCLLDCEVIKNA